MDEQIQLEWPESGSAEETWAAVKSVLTEAAETTLGGKVNHQPDCFKEGFEHLLPLLNKHNKLY